MAKWYGKVGYIVNEEVQPGIWQNRAIEKPYFGDTLSNTSKWSSAGKVNDDLDVALKISIMADPFADQNLQSIKYVEYMGSMWEVSTIDPQPPRLVLTMGGVYNGEQA